MLFGTERGPVRPGGDRGPYPAHQNPFALVAASLRWQQLDGQALVIFIMCVAAAEVAVGLALVVAIFRNRATVSVDDLNLMKW